jgi:hypothetical protein
MRKVGEVFQSDWLSIWALNVHLDTFDPAAGTEVLIGRLYVVQTGDTLQTIAKEFGACSQPDTLDCAAPCNPWPKTWV